MTRNTKRWCERVLGVWTVFAPLVFGWEVFHGHQIEWIDTRLFLQVTSYAVVLTVCVVLGCWLIFDESLHAGES